MSVTITITPNEQTFDTLAAWRIIGTMLAQPKAVIGLSTGQTTTNIHAVICDIHKQYPFDVQGVTVFNLDEVMNVPREYAGACYTMIKDQLVDPLGIPYENFVMPPTEAEDMAGECVRFQTELERRGGIDLQMLGLGTNGHIGFNQPGSLFGQETWLSEMDEALDIRIRRETGTPPEKQLGGLTLGIKNIMHARKIVLVAKGAHKAAIVKQVLEGPVTEQVPASILQLHPNCEFILDAAAAAQLTQTTQS